MVVYVFVLIYHGIRLFWGWFTVNEAGFSSDDRPPPGPLLDYEFQGLHTKVAAADYDAYLFFAPVFWVS